MKDSDTAWGEYRESGVYTGGSLVRADAEMAFKAGWLAALNALREHQATERAAAEDRKPL